MKKLWLTLFMMILLVGTVSAYDFSGDNYKVASEDNKTIQIWDKAFIGEDTLLGTIELKTPIKYKVGVGKGVQVAEFKATNEHSFVSDLIEEMELYDLNDNWKETNKEMEFKYKIIEIKQKPIYNELDCSYDDTLGFDVCNKEIVGYENYTEESWEKYNPKQIEQGETLTIGVFTDTVEGENIEWIPKIYGLRITEWASWDAGLNVDLIAYWKMNETSGNLEDFVGDTDLSPQSSPLYQQDGIINGSISSDSADDSFANTTVTTVGTFNFTSTYDFTYSFWYYYSGTGSAQDGIILGGGTTSSSGTLRDDTLTFTHFNDGACKNQINVWSASRFFTDISGLCDGTFHHIVFRRSNSGTNFTVYVDGSIYNSSTILARTINAKDWTIGGDDVNNRPMTGRLDEFGIWNRSLSEAEITQLYNGGSGITYSDFSDVLPEVTLNSPVNAFNSSSADITFNCTATDDIKIENVTLYIDGVAQTINTSGYNGTYIFDETGITEGSHNWTCGAFDNASQETTPSVRTFTVDITNPSVTAIYPSGTINSHEANTNLTFNYTITDTNIANCWINFEGVNYSITCGTNETSFNITNSGINSATLFANDSAGNLGTDTYIWDYDFFIVDETYTSSVLEGETSSFTKEIITNGDAITSAILNYNGTEEAATISSSGNNYTLTRTRVASLVDADTNLTFYWNITDENGANYQSTSLNQTVIDFDIDDCSINNDTLYNFTIVDEIAQTLIASANTDAKANLQIYSTDRSSTIIDFAQNYTATNPFAICLNSDLSTGASYVLDLQLQYEAENYSVEFYHIQNDTLDSTSFNENITLYNLDDDNYQEFKITFKDENFLAVEDALIIVQRKYIDEGVFKTVEIAKTDSNGETLVHLQLSDVIYTIIVQKNGEVLATFNNVIALCDNVATGDCEINLNAFGTSVPVDDFSSSSGIQFTLTFDETTRKVQSVFSTDSGSTETMNLIVTKSDNFGTNSVCNDTLTTSSGTLSCVVPTSFGNETIRAEIQKSDDLIGYSLIQLDEEPTDIYGGSYVLINLIIMGTMLGAGVSGSVVLTSIFLILSLLSLVGLHLMNGQFIGSGATFLWLIVAIGIVMWKVTRRESNFT